jgi:hypothetical protein
MAFISKDWDNDKGKSVGNGQCVAYVHKTAGTPRTRDWSPGAKVQGNSGLKRGTAIAVFNKNGNYANRSGYSHAAIYLGQTRNGILVADQYKGKSVGVREIRVKDADKPVNDARNYRVIEPRPRPDRHG